MQKLFVPLSCVIVLLTLAAVTFAVGPRGTQERCEFGDAAAKRAVAAVIPFAIRIYKEFAYNKTLENIVFSPVSIALGLALLEAGASAGTQKELQAHLGAPAANQSDSSTFYQSLQRQLQIRDEKATLSIANGLFHKDGLNLRPDYLSKTSKCFDTEVQKAPFSDNVEEARRQVNQWVANATGEKIPELFKPGVLTADAVAVLANAIHMKAAWKVPFYRSENLPFYRYGQTNQAQTTHFMVDHGEYLYHEDSKIQWIEIPYEGGLSLNIVLPKQRDGIQSIEDDMTSEARAAFTTSKAGDVPREVTLKIPKFGARSTLELGRILQQMSVKRIFTDDADFSRLASKRVKISTAVHEAYIKVNENGTEAAAATGFGVVEITSGSISDQPPVNFTTDHPFIYIIWHKATQAPLFVGKINYIEEEAPDTA